MKINLDQWYAAKIVSERNGFMLTEIAGTGVLFSIGKDDAANLHAGDVVELQFSIDYYTYPVLTYITMRKGHELFKCVGNMEDEGCVGNRSHQHGLELNQ